MLQFLPQVIQLAGMVKDMLDDDDNSATPDHAEKSMKKKLTTETLGFLDEIIEKGGRYDEFDLYGNRGGYVRLMDRNAVNRPCPSCGGQVEKIQYLGGACYVCHVCQV